MARNEQVTYKTTGRHSGEAFNFPGGIRIEFRHYLFTTSNPVEIMAIENSGLYEEGKILRIGAGKEVLATKEGPGTMEGPLGFTAPIDGQGETRKQMAQKDAEIAELRARLDALENQKPVDSPPDLNIGQTGEPEGQTETVQGEGESKVVAPPAGDPEDKKKGPSSKK